MKALQILGFILIAYLTLTTNAQEETTFVINQLELTPPSQYEVREASDGSATIYADNGMSQILITTQATDEIFPTAIAQIANTNRPEPLTYVWASLDGVPALVADVMTEDGSAGYRHALAVWQGTVYDIVLTPFDQNDTIVTAQTETLWADIIENIAFLPADDSPHFTLFESNVSTIQDNSSRINVSWELQNRPDDTNLEFVQILPDDLVENVELPRDDPFVTSSGSGILEVAIPDDESTSVVLQVRLIDLSDERIIAVRQLVLPVDDLSTLDTRQATTSTNSANPIVLFQADVDVVAGLTTVTWEIEANHVDELRYYSTGVRTTIIELLPEQVSGSYTFSCWCRQGDTQDSPYNQAELVVEIDGHQYTTVTSIQFVDNDSNTAPQITQFQGTNRNLSVNSLPAQVSVDWQVINRPENTNLEFIQIFPDGQWVNAELPRTDPYVASTGTGIVNLISTQSYDLSSRVELRVQIRLIANTTGNILTSRELIVPYLPPAVAEPPSETVTVQSFTITSEQSIPEIWVNWTIQANHIDNLQLEVTNSDGVVAYYVLPAQLSGSHQITGVLPDIYSTPHLVFTSSGSQYRAPGTILRVAESDVMTHICNFDVNRNNDGSMRITWEVCGVYDEIGIQWVGSNGNNFSIGLAQQGNFLDMSADDVANYYGITEHTVLTLRVVDLAGNVITEQATPQ